MTALALMAPLAIVPGASEARAGTLSIAGASFSPRESGIDAADTSGGVLKGIGTFIAPLPLRNGSTILGLTLVGAVTASGESATATLYQLDTSIYSLANPAPVASVAIAGPTTGAPVTRSVAIPAVAVDVARYYYFVGVEEQGSGMTCGVRVDYQDPSPAPATESIGVAGLAFDPATSGVDLKSDSKGAVLYVGPLIPARFIAPVRLPQGAVVTALTTTALDDGDFDAAMHLIKVPRATYGGGTVMATVSTSGSVIDIPRTFTTTTVTSATIDNTTAFYYLELEMPNYIDVYGAVVSYIPPATPPVYDADALAAVPFLPERTGTDLRVPVSDTLAGASRFDLGLRLPDGEQVTTLGMAVHDNAAGGDLSLSLYRLDTATAGATPFLMATVASQGAVDGMRFFSTSTVLGRAVDNSRYFYYARFDTGSAPVQGGGLIVETRPCGDLDGDGYDGCVNDCDDTDPTRWSAPSEVTGLAASFDNGTGVTTLTWSPPVNPGGTAPPVYDTLLSSSPGDFLTAGVCVETAGADTTTALTGPLLGPGQALYFLVRPISACGAGPLGFDGNGTLVTGRACP
jgi:hypothetical protein